MRTRQILAIVAVLLFASLTAAVSRAEPALRLDLPSQPLSESLTDLGQEARVNIAFDPAVVRGLRAPAMQGTYDIETGLTLLLKDTDLDFTRTAGGSIVIGRKTPKPVVPLAPEQPISPPRPEPIPQVIVTATPNFLTPTLARKRAYSGVMDGASGREIVRPPESNLTETVQNVPGVAMAHDQGEGRSLSVRGLGPDFTRVEINGLETQAATDGLSQGVNKGRGFDFNVFPADLFDHVDVMKTSSADQPEGSLGATVNLRTLRASDHIGLHMKASVRRSYGELSESYGTRASFKISNQFADNRLGVALAVAYAYTPFRIQGANSGGWNYGTANGGFCPPTINTGGLCDVPEDEWERAQAAYVSASSPQTLYPQFYRYAESVGVQRRLGLTSSVQWRPTERTTLSLDMVYSQYETLRQDYFLEAIGFSRGASQGGKPEIVVRDIAFGPNQTMAYGRFDNVDIRAEASADEFKTTFYQGAIQIQHEVTPKLSLEALAGSSRSKFDNYRELTVHIDRFNVDGYSFDIRSSGQDLPAINYGFDVANADNWYFGPLVTQTGGTGAMGPEIRLRPNYVSNGFDIVEATLKYAFQDNYALDLGFQAKRYLYDAVSYRFDAGESDFPEPTLGLDQLTTVFCGLEAIAPPEGTPRCWRVPDLAAFGKAYDLYANSGRTSLSTTNIFARGRNQSVVEDDLAVYTQLRFSQPLGGRTVRGDMGVRYVETRQTSLFYDQTSDLGLNSNERLMIRRTYRNLLPSLNLSVDMDKKRTLRFGVASVIVRPPLSSIAAATSVTVNGSKRQVVTGNPNIKPISAINYDLSYEWYSKNDQFFALGVFYKHITNYVHGLVYIAPYSTTGLPEALLQNTGVTAEDDFHIVSYVNTPGGYLAGFELNYQQPLVVLHPGLKGLSFNFAYTYVDSQIDYESAYVGLPRVEADLLNLSRHASTLSLAYRRSGFQFKVSRRYRDQYLTNVPGFFNADASGVRPATYWDLSASYRIKPGLTISFEGQNLSNERQTTWDRSALQLVEDTRLSGRVYHIGLRYTF